MQDLKTHVARGKPFCSFLGVNGSGKLLLHESQGGKWGFGAPTCSWQGTGQSVSSRKRQPGFLFNFGAAEREKVRPGLCVFTIRERPEP